MVTRISYYSFRFAFGLTILLILIGSRYTDKISYPESQNNCECPSPISNSDVQPTPLPPKPNFEKILNETRMSIKFDLRKYNFTDSGVRKLEDLLLESGGKPIRNVIVSTWRSGSTFFGEILNAVPGNFYHYEPLLTYGMKQLRGPPHAKKALNSLKSMFYCNFTGAKHYFTHGKKHWEQFSHNTKLWEYCNNKKELCYDVDFTDQFCKLFPFQSMKVLRVRLHLIEALLEDSELNVKVVLLVRDPRGVMQSRLHWIWCRPAPDCWDPKLVCGDMVSDYFAARRLSQKYPDRVMVLRYEDLTLNPNSRSRQVLNFLRLSYTVSVEEFLHAHGTFEIPGISSTFRVSREMPFRWKKVLDFELVEKIQSDCKEAMDHWGYRQALNASHLTSKNFYPLQRLRWRK